VDIVVFRGSAILLPDDTNRYIEYNQSFVFLSIDMLVIKTLIDGYLN